MFGVLHVVNSTVHVKSCVGLTSDTRFGSDRSPQHSTQSAYLVLLEQAFDSARQPVYRLVFLVHHLLQDKPHIVYFNSIVLERCQGIMVHLTGVQECLQADRVDLACYTVERSHTGRCVPRTLEGIHPTLRQVPPSLPRPSIHVTFLPNCAALIAAT